MPILVCWDNAHKFGPLHGAVKPHALALGEFDNASENGVKSVVFAALNVFARVHFGAALADKHFAGVHSLAVADFGPEVLRIGIAAQSGGAARLFV